ncbi:unnamed protein product, partial [Allacma fusca]
QAKVSNQVEVVDVLDRKTGSQYIFRTVGSDEKGKLYTSEGSAFISGDGNFGGQPRTDKPVAKTMPRPNEPPDAILEYKVGLDQPALYRLTGDYNPLHIDPAFAKLARFDRTITHGNCMLGIAAQ